MIEMSKGEIKRRRLMMQVDRAMKLLLALVVVIVAAMSLRTWRRCSSAPPFGSFAAMRDGRPSSPSQTRSKDTPVRSTAP